MTSNEIQRYSKKTVPNLIKIADRHFNKYIRNRDKINDQFFRCITCKKSKAIVSDNYHACHLFPKNTFPHLRYDEDNVHGGCKRCNYFLHGAGYNYVDSVIEKIGKDAYDKLIQRRDIGRRGFKWDRFALIAIIIKYKELNK